MVALELKPLWHSLSTEQKNIVASRLLDSLEVSDRKKRMNAARCVLYLIQVCVYSILFYCTVHYYKTSYIKYIGFRVAGLNVSQIKINRLMQKKMYYFYTNLVFIMYLLIS